MALYHTWRPQKLEDVIGQDHVTNALLSVLPDKSNHAYLFSGPRGTGKTTTARLIAKILNCEGDNPPCRKCVICQEIENGNHSDLVEMDAASNRGIGDIRALKDRLLSLPIRGKYKIFIIDEVHMLTMQAANAILKSLEEPPKHVVFVLATTEEQKILATIKSRCQIHRFRLIGSDVIYKRLRLIVINENLSFSEDSLNLIAQEARGSMRDAISLLELMSGLPDKSSDMIQRVLGKSDYQTVYEFATCLEERDTAKAFNCIERIYKTGKVDMLVFRDDIIAWLRGLMLVSIGAKYNHPMLSKMSEQQWSFTREDLIRTIRIFAEEVYCAFLPTLHLEIAATDAILGMSEVGDF